MTRGLLQIYYWLSPTVKAFLKLAQYFSKLWTNIEWHATVYKADSNGRKNTVKIHDNADSNCTYNN